ncbi:MAG TPA: PPOX class F420-dependent oxidoreductase [Nitrososphaerales archaeon]|nr:PPOX class F420-dependent oxidoreductase [Nitrososphaerales archaeon]
MTQMGKLDPGVVKFLRGKYFGKLATTMRDGSPHVTPIWYMLEDRKILINTTTTRVKYFNIKRDNRICLLVDDGYPYVIVFGRARVAKGRDPRKDIETLAIRYTGAAAGRKAARERYWKQERVTIEIIPDRVVYQL